eukprot:m.127972 g.127972  ORF g.127972 m.127972 type:complete len:967 (-) comp16378_c0_seq3:132-3032(-)
MASLRALLLVVKDSQTPARILFWYPRSLPHRPAPGHTPVVRSELRRYLSHAHEEAANIFNPKVERRAVSENAGESLADEFASVFGLSGRVLADTLSVPAIMCDAKFEFHLDGYVFVSHPIMIESTTDSNNSFMYSMVCLLQGPVPARVVDSYHTLALRVSVALRHEERRHGYLSTVLQAMIEAHDHCSQATQSVDIIATLLTRSPIARNMTTLFSSLTTKGFATLKIGGWVLVTFTVDAEELPITERHYPGFVERDDVRPYHALLLLSTPADLLEKLPKDCSSELVRVVRAAHPSKSFEALSAEIDVPLLQVMRLADHLVLWREAKIVFPVCKTNVYLTNPSLDRRLLSENVRSAFSRQFGDKDLISWLSDFSRPMPLSEHMDLSDDNERLLRVLQWLLQRDAIVLLQTYISLVVPSAATIANRSDKERVRLRLADRDGSEDDSQSIGSFQQDGVRDSALDDNGTSPFQRSPSRASLQLAHSRVRTTSQSSSTMSLGVKSNKTSPLKPESPTRSRRETGYEADSGGWEGGGMTGGSSSVGQGEWAGPRKSSISGIMRTNERSSSVPLHMVGPLQERAAASGQSRVRGSSSVGFILPTTAKSRPSPLHTARSDREYDSDSTAEAEGELEGAFGASPAAAAAAASPASAGPERSPRVSNDGSGSGGGSGVGISLSADSGAGAAGRGKSGLGRSSGGSASGIASSGVGRGGSSLGLEGEAHTSQAQDSLPIGTSGVVSASSGNQDAATAPSTATVSPAGTGASTPLPTPTLPTSTSSTSSFAPFAIFSGVPPPTVAGGASLTAEASGSGKNNTDKSPGRAPVAVPAVHAQPPTPSREKHQAKQAPDASLTLPAADFGAEPATTPVDPTVEEVVGFQPQYDWTWGRDASWGLGSAVREKSSNFLTRREHEYVLNLPAAASAAMLDRFLRLCPYFRGVHSLEEIMWLENISRNDVLEVVSHFSDVLVVSVF